LWLSLDPGKTTGWATFYPEGTNDDMGWMGIDETRKFVREGIWEGIICEDWKLRPEAAKFMVWSDMPTSKLIGYIEGVCAERDIPFILQQPAVKPNAYKLAGRKSLPKSNPMNHAMDAYVHGVYYMIKNNILKV